ncbi:MAG TPA: methionine adenosyltransferase [Candidatus Limnocylindria bacterium]|nr:methionine adenosyltransferase [Candidatus Limnocylindria bacterium]
MSRENRNFLFTSESVTEGHPDKIADQISDAVLDAVLEQDPMGRVACETLVTTGLAVVAGEVTTKAHLEYADIVRGVIRDVGYTRAKFGYDADTCGVICAVKRQSGDIAMGVDTGGAGDQGLMFGYACDETDELMPMPIQLAHGLTRRLAVVRKNGVVGFLRPDGKSQVTVEYRRGQPARVDCVVVSTQHSESVSNSDLRDAVENEVIRPVIPASMLDKQTKFHINPTGRFVIGGPMGDAGLTGRKIIVDTYGGYSRHGGGALSGKDPTKVDRSACYMARYVAKNLVAAGLARKVEVQLAYAIGVAEPVSVMADTFDTGVIPDEKITDLIRAYFQLTPRAIMETLNLRRPIYRPTAAYGHFGRSEAGFTWEKTDKAEAIRKEAGLPLPASARAEVAARR